MNLVSPALIALRIFGWIWTKAWPEIASKWLSRRDLVQHALKNIARQVVYLSLKQLINGGGNPRSEAFQNAQRVLPQPLHLIWKQHSK